MRGLALAALCAAGVMALAGQANALGPPLTFTLSNSDPAGNGTLTDVAITTGGPDRLVQGFILTGSDLGSGPATPNTAMATAVATAAATQDLAGVYWSYSSADPRGGAFDPAGYIVNGVKHQLTYDQEGIGQTDFRLTRYFVIPLVAGDTFGFYIDSTDSLGGAASVQITLGSNAIPEPASWALMISGFGLAGASLRRRRGSAAAT